MSRTAVCTVQLETVQLLPESYVGEDYVAGMSVSEPCRHGNAERPQQPYNVDCQRSTLHATIDELLICLSVSACLSVCKHDKTKTAENTITKLDTRVRNSPSRYLAQTRSHEGCI